MLCGQGLKREENLAGLIGITIDRFRKRASLHWGARRSNFRLILIASQPHFQTFITSIQISYLPGIWHHLKLLPPRSFLLSHSFRVLLLARTRLTSLGRLTVPFVHHFCRHNGGFRGLSSSLRR